MLGKVLVFPTMTILMLFGKILSTTFFEKCFLLGLYPRCILST